MYRLHGIGFHSRPQIGRNSFGRGHFQSLGQDWPEPGKVSSEVSSPRCTKGIASKRRIVRQPGTKEALICEEFSPAKTLVHTRSKRSRVPSRFVHASRQRSSASASQQWEYFHKARWNSLD